METLNMSSEERPAWNAIAFEYNAGNYLIRIAGGVQQPKKDRSTSPTMVMITALIIT